MPSNILNLAASAVCKIDSDDHNYYIEAVAAVAPKPVKYVIQNRLLALGKERG